MISDIEQASPATEVFVPEFGLLDIQHLDAGRKYQGRIYRMSAETMKALSDAIGFAAKFDSPTVRTAYADIFKTAGRAILEIDRNTNPTDVSVRYTRDRWNVSGVVSKGAEVLRPWVSTQYRAAFLPEKVFIAIGGEAKISLQNIEHFYIRLNFKDRTIGLIGEEARAAEFPGGAFAVVSVPAANVTTITLAESMEESVVVEEEGVFTEMEEQTFVEAEILGSDEQIQLTDDETITSSESETAATHAEQIVDVEQMAGSAQGAAVEQAPNVEQAEKASADNEPGQQSGFFREQPKVEPKPEPAPAPAPVQAPPPLQAPPAYQQTQRSFANRASAESSMPQIKYAVYSKSEVDQMLKQQSDAVTNGLQGKINSQQRLLQDLIANQERTFAKLSDKFVTEIEAARLKIDSSTKHASDTTKHDLQEFKTQLSKELEQYRAQINKNIIPLGKTIDEKIKALKETALDKNKGKGKEDIRALVIKIAVVLAILILASDVLVVVNMVKMSELLNMKSQVSILSDKIDKMNTPETHPAPGEPVAPVAPAAK